MAGHINSKRAKGVDGNIYASIFEASFGNDLFFLKKAKKIINYEIQKELPLVINGYLIGHYTADFVIYHLDGSKELVETKGWATPTFRLRWKIVEALYTDEYKITCITQNKKQRLGKIKKITEIYEGKKKKKSTNRNDTKTII